VALILDTIALSAFADGDEKLLHNINKEFELAVPVVVLGEYLCGVHGSRFRLRYEEWLESNIAVFEVLPIGRETAQRYAEIRRELKAAGRPIPSNDVWIAALAREHGFPLLSRDDHFRAVQGLDLLTW
jgi:predicted nucleic acid-binding protein